MVCQWCTCNLEIIVYTCVALAATDPNFLPQLSLAGVLLTSFTLISTSPCFSVFWTRQLSFHVYILTLVMHYIMHSARARLQNWWTEWIPTNNVTDRWRMRIAEPHASNSSMLYACKLQLCKTVLDGATCVATGEEDFTVAHRESVTPGNRKMKTFILVQFNR